MLGGCESKYKGSMLNDAIDKFNNSFVDGKGMTDFLNCPAIKEDPAQR